MEIPLATVQSTNRQLFQSQPLTIAVFGGTAGIGESTVRAIARTCAESNGKGVRVYIVGRNKVAGERIASECLAMCPEPRGWFKFVQVADLALMRDVDSACATIVKTEESCCEAQYGSSIGKEKAKVDFLVTTQGVLSLDTARNPTSEGLPFQLSLMYYSRIRCIWQLLPLLQRSEIGHAVSVLNPKLAGALVPDDLGLKHHYGFKYGASHVVWMKTMMFEQLANRYNISCIHNYPGIVMTNMADTGGLPLWAKWLWKYFFAIVLSPWQTKLEECGDRHLFFASSRFKRRTDERKKETEDIEVANASDGVVGGGAYRIGSRGEEMKNLKNYEEVKAQIYDKVWEHTKKAFETIEKGGVFDG
jgi:NAD(P)-dependent dehydrogenase (short-subunit alcohol dehydrogenase family)